MGGAVSPAQDPSPPSRLSWTPLVSTPQLLCDPEATERPWLPIPTCGEALPGPLPWLCLENSYACLKTHTVCCWVQPGLPQPGPASPPLCFSIPVCPGSHLALHTGKEESLGLGGRSHPGHLHPRPHPGLPTTHFDGVQGQLDHRTLFGGQTLGFFSHHVVLDGWMARGDRMSLGLFPPRSSLPHSTWRSLRPPWEWACLCITPAPSRRGSVHESSTLIELYLKPPHTAGSTDSECTVHVQWAPPSPPHHPRKTPLPPPTMRPLLLPPPASPSVWTAGPAPWLH